MKMDARESIKFILECAIYTGTKRDENVTVDGRSIVSVDCLLRLAESCPVPIEYESSSQRDAEMTSEGQSIVDYLAKRAKDCASSEASAVLMDVIECLRRAENWYK